MPAPQDTSVLSSSPASENGTGEQYIDPARRTGQIAIAVFLVAFYLYFLQFAADGLNSWFSNDDLMNLHYYWVRSWPELLKANVLFFTDYYRPMGGLFYKSLHAVWGMQPEPYRIVALIVVTLNLVLLFLVARSLSRSTEVAAAALFLAGVNGSFTSIYYDNGMIYDVLAYFFYFSAFYYYLRIRTTGALPNAYQTVIFLALFICALNSKEIAISLPVAIFFYEWLYHPPRNLRWGSLWLALRRWSIGPGRVALLGGLAAAIYLAGKYHGQDSLFKLDAYRPQPSASRFLEGYAYYLKGMTQDGFRPSRDMMLAILLGILVVVAAFRRKYLVLAALMVGVSFLPLGFIAPRGGFAFYLPSFYWALWLAGVLVTTRRWLAEVIVKSIDRMAGGHRTREIARVVEIVTLCVLWLGLAGTLLPMNHTAFSQVLPIVHDVQNRNRAVATQLRQCLPSLPRGTRVLLLDDPYSPDDIYMPYFLIRESYGDSTLKVDRSKLLRLQGIEPELANYDVTVSLGETSCRATWQ